MKEREEIELNVTPDPNCLDQEWVEQPRLRFRYGVELADARSELLAAKSNLDVTEAELDAAIRSEPTKFDVAKVTEGSVKAAVLTQAEYQAAKKAVIARQHDVDVLEAAVAAVDHRKKALEDLVQLHLAGYYASPRAPEGAREQMDDVSKASIRRKGRARVQDGVEN